MKLDDKANQGFKQNRNVSYENPPKTLAHMAGYHYPSARGDHNKNRFIRPPERLASQSINVKGIPSTRDGKRDYHYPSGPGLTSPLSMHPLGVLNSNEGKGYDYPSGKGETSPIVGTVLAGRPSRGTGSNGQIKSDGKMKGSSKVGSRSISSYSERGSCSDCEREDSED
jgi:hypothetical protein